MLRISKKILYLILLNIYIFNNQSDASFLSFIKGIFSSSKSTNDEQVLSEDNKPVELKVPVSSYILQQIKEINNVDIKNKQNSRIKDDNFNTIQVQQQQVLEILNDYNYDTNIFNKCLINIKQIIATIDFYNTLFKQRNDFSKLIIELNDILEKSYNDALMTLNKSFDKLLDIITFIKLLFKEKDGLINKMLLLDNAVSLNENEIKIMISNCINTVDAFVDKETLKYYNSILAEVDARVRNKKLMLPSQVLFILFYYIRDELFNKSNELYESYVSFKNKITLANQKLTSINDNIKDNIQILENSSNINNTVNNEEAIATSINIGIKELNRNNSDVIDVIERTRNAVKSIIDLLNVFKNYVPDEKILSFIEQEKDQDKNNKNNKSENIKDKTIASKQSETKNEQVNENKTTKTKE